MFGASKLSSDGEAPAPSTPASTSPLPRLCQPCRSSASSLSALSAASSCLADSRMDDVHAGSLDLEASPPPEAAAPPADKPEKAERAGGKGVISPLCQRAPLLSALLLLSLMIVHDPQLAWMESIVFLASRSRTPAPGHSDRLAAVLGLVPTAPRAEQIPSPLRSPAWTEAARWASGEGHGSGEDGPTSGAEARPALARSLPDGWEQLGSRGTDVRQLLHPITTWDPATGSDWSDLPVLHQTVKNLVLTQEQLQWRASWIRLGFRVRTADNAQARRDIVRMVDMTGDSRLLRVYDALETNVQRSDVWRYAILWLEGGIYADIDVYAHPPITSLVQSSPGVIFTESLPLFDWMPSMVARGISFVALHLGLTDLVRLPQRRNCIMLAPKRHPLMLHTLQRIVAKFEAEHHLAPRPEPTHTLELTGPGILTDALNELVAAHGGLAVGLDALRIRLVSRFDGMQYFQHVAQGTWKTYLGDARVHGLKPHERTLRWVVLLMQSTGVVLYVLVCTHTRLRLSPRGVALHLLPVSIRQKLGCSAHDSCPVVKCRLRSSCFRWICEGAHQCTRRLAMRLLAVKRRLSACSCGECESSSSATRNRREAATKVVSAPCTRSGSAPSRLSDFSNSSFGLTRGASSSPVMLDALPVFLFDSTTHRCR